MSIFGKLFGRSPEGQNPPQPEREPVTIWMSCGSCGWRSSALGEVKGTRIKSCLDRLQALAEGHYGEYGGQGHKHTRDSFVIYGGSEHREFHCWVGDKSGGYVVSSHQLKPLTALVFLPEIPMIIRGLMSSAILPTLFVLSEVSTPG